MEASLIKNNNNSITDKEEDRVLLQCTHIPSERQALPCNNQRVCECEHWSCIWNSVSQHLYCEFFILIGLLLLHIHPALKVCNCSEIFFSLDLLPHASVLYIEFSVALFFWSIRNDNFSNVRISLVTPVCLSGRM
jgi:hypothetical protein